MVNIIHTTSGVSDYFRTSTRTIFYRNKQKAKFKTKKKHNMKERERKHFYTTTTPDELSIGELMYRAKEGI